MTSTPADPITVRRAAADDLADVAGLFCGYLDFYHRPTPAGRVLAFLRERHERGESVLFLARAADGAPAGFANVYPTFSSLSMAPVWTLNDLFVAAAARRTGAGRALVRAVTEAARAAGAVAVQLQTAPDNATAQALYRSEGFQPDAFAAYYLPLTA
ncbi:GNAT family N-acetyltransferase [Actinoplanes philippinensis]|uniref:GNAT family N-acetyltransferase n=1 Tax=Actinoplanes philippinensis TaxID=35752 RepID=UPI0033EAAEA4